MHQESSDAFTPLCVPSVHVAVDVAPPEDVNGSLAHAHSVALTRTENEVDMSMQHLSVATEVLREHVQRFVLHLH